MMFRAFASIAFDDGASSVVSLATEAESTPSLTVGGHSEEGCGLPGQIEIHRTGVGDADFGCVLHMALDLPAKPNAHRMLDTAVELLERARLGQVSIDLLFGAYLHDELISAALVIESPGGAAMAVAPTRVASQRWVEATEKALDAARRGAWERGAVMVQVLTPPDAAGLPQALQGSGFQYLTRLVYLRRGVETPRPNPRVDGGLEWLTYEPQYEGLFGAAIIRSYVESLDCPELTGLRSPSEVLLGYRAAGEFDPTCWFVASRGGEAVGVILLNRVGGSDTLELVYMGVAQPFRGKGVADALLGRAMDEMEARNAKDMALAVDQRNEPARKVYARWGFVEMARRDAWLARRPDA